MKLDYMAFFPHEGRMVFHTVKGLEIYFVWDTIWLDQDVSEKPFSIYIYTKNSRYTDGSQSARMCSTLLYHFKTRKEITDFMNYIIENNKIEKLAEELMEHSERLKLTMKNKIKQEKPVFQAVLQEKDIQLKDFFYLQKNYDKLPTYLKRYFKKIGNG